MYIDPEIRHWLSTLTPLDIADLPAARRVSASNQKGDIFPGIHDGKKKVMGDGSRVIVNVHGGGFVLGCTSSDNPENELLVRELGVTVVSPEYGLAPENPYPGPLNQCAEVLQYVVEELDDHPIIMGHSAGGGLAAMLTQWAVKNGITPSAQILIEPRGRPHLHLKEHAHLHRRPRLDQGQQPPLLAVLPERKQPHPHRDRGPGASR